jgi:hypothetical protein
MPMLAETTLIIRCLLQVRNRLQANDRPQTKGSYCCGGFMFSMTSPSLSVATDTPFALI